MNKALIIFGICIFCLVGVVSAFDTFNVNEPVDLIVRVQYDNNVSLSNIPLSVCNLSVYTGVGYVLSNVSMIPNGQYHHYVFTPTVAGYYYASVFCSYLGENSLYLFNFNVTVPVDNGVHSGAGSGGGGSSTLVPQAMIPSIVPDRSSYTVNLLSDSVLKFDTQYSLDNKLSTAKSSSYQLLKDGNVIDSGLLSSTSVGTYTFDYDFVSLPVGQYQVALDFDGKLVLVDVNVVSNSNNIFTGLITADDGSVSAGKLGVAIFVLIFIIVAIVLLVRTLTKKPRR
jgi:hypothetical protein